MLEVILRRIKPGSINISDCWAAYINLAVHGYNHLTVNQKYNIVDLLTHVHAPKSTKYMVYIQKEK